MKICTLLVFDLVTLQVSHAYACNKDLLLNILNSVLMDIFFALQIG